MYVNQKYLNIYFDLTLITFPKTLIYVLLDPACLNITRVSRCYAFEKQCLIRYVWVGEWVYNRECVRTCVCVCACVIKIHKNDFFYIPEKLNKVKSREKNKT